ncbi:MAG TPA: hypothetical protein VF250_05745, partial [Conexibacter sp.]
WKAGTDANGVWMAAYAAPAYAGRPLPIAAVPRTTRQASPAQPLAPPRDSARERDRFAGAGGLGHAGDGVAVAGGGGHGAPLFSRPQPQSRGRRAGEVRDPAGPRRDAQHAGARSSVAAGRAAAGERTAARGGAAGDGRVRVSGLVLGDGRHAAIAPGLSAARAGGRAPGSALPLALTAALALCGVLGAAHEARRPPLARPTGEAPA